MPILATMGVKAVYYAPANTADNTIMPTTGWKTLEVYEDTCTFEEPDPTVTKHKSETSSKLIVQKSKEPPTLKLSVMDPSMDVSAEFKGTTVTGTTGSKKMKDSVKANNKEYAFKILPEAGLCLNLSAAIVTAKRKTTYSSKGITLLELEIDPIQPYEDSEDVTTPTA